MWSVNFQEDVLFCLHLELAKVVESRKSKRIPRSTCHSPCWSSYCPIFPVFWLAKDVNQTMFREKLIMWEDILKAQIKLSYNIWWSWNSKYVLNQKSHKCQKHFWLIKELILRTEIYLFVSSTNLWTLQEHFWLFTDLYPYCMVYLTHSSYSNLWNEQSPNKWCFKLLFHDDLFFSGDSPDYFSEFKFTPTYVFSLQQLYQHF